MSSTLDSGLQEDLRRVFTGNVEAIQDPYPVYARLLEESPVHRYDSSRVIVSRHADVKATYHRRARGEPGRKHFGADPARCR